MWLIAIYDAVANVIRKLIGLPPRDPFSDDGIIEDTIDAIRGKESDENE